MTPVWSRGGEGDCRLGRGGGVESNCEKLWENCNTVRNPL